MTPIHRRYKLITSCEELDWEVFEELDQKNYKVSEYLSTKIDSFIGLYAVKEQGEIHYAFLTRWFASYPKRVCMWKLSPEGVQRCKEIIVEQKI